MSNDTQVKQEAPERVWITWDDAYPWLTPAMGGDEYVRADLLATVRREEREAALAAICPALCGACANVADNVGLEGPRVLFDGHWVHLWKETGTYSQRCFADMAIRALEAAASEKGEMNG